MVGYTEIPKFEGETDQVSDEIWSVDAAVNKDGAVNIWMISGREDGRLTLLAAFRLIET